MGKQKTKSKKKKRISGTTRKEKTRSVPEIILERLEFHRNGFSLLPADSDKNPGLALVVLSENKTISERICSCGKKKRTPCPHLEELLHLLFNESRSEDLHSIEEHFQASIWHRICQAIASMKRVDLQAITVREKDNGSETSIEVTDNHGEVLLQYRSSGPDALRLRQRLRDQSDTIGKWRHLALERLRQATLTPAEYELAVRKLKSRRQTFEAGFWYLMAYHAFREFGGSGLSIHPRMDSATGQFKLSVGAEEKEPKFDLTVPKAAVNRLLTDPSLPSLKKDTFSISTDSVKPTLKVWLDKRGCLRIKPLYQFAPGDEKPRYFSPEELSKFRFGNMFCPPGSHTLVPVEFADSLFNKFRESSVTVIKKALVPDFLGEHGGLLKNPRYLLDPSVTTLKVYRRSERIRLEPKAMDRDWCYLSVKYSYGGSQVSLAEMLAAKKKGKKYLPVEDGWVDLDAANLEDYKTGPEMVREGKEQWQTPLSRSDILKLQAAMESPLEVSGEGIEADRLRNLLELKPFTEPPSIESMTSPLRKYQRMGFKWLWFLRENGFGGLLCDDMGLGKTHQVMALMTCLVQKNRVPFLVVCPTTVISHWTKKIREHAPLLACAIHHGPERDLEENLQQAHVLITSYGVMLRDIESLAQTRFSLCVFDEIQNIKNPETQSCKAAKQILADMKLGLTGTPIENSILDLKTLLDLTIPQFLDQNTEFRKWYEQAEQGQDDNFAKARLSRLISPFTLRRLKSSVLDELPEKIEDTRTCDLSQDQVQLYMEALESRRKVTIDSLGDKTARIPYMHIFALLTLLKQICDHPALVDKNVDKYEERESGKWELFKEILDESLQSGQKVVVFSQFLDMIRIIEKHLIKNDVGFSVLTGASRDRGEIISRFNTDPDCRVFVGSLKAGGTGIDLVAGSVVIHYDRWWNAAREDQATDRVHRIGQRRGVQVFKLVTEGTLEEKIGAIIDKKRNLMEKVVREDDPNLLKTFTREELLDLLSFPPSFRPLPSVR